MWHYVQFIVKHEPAHEIPTLKKSGKLFSWCDFAKLFLKSNALSMWTTTLTLTGCACNVSMMSFGGEIKSFEYTYYTTLHAYGRNKSKHFGFLVWFGFKCRKLQHKCYLWYSFYDVRTLRAWISAYACAASIQPKWCIVIRFCLFTHFKFHAKQQNTCIVCYTNV